MLENGKLIGCFVFLICGELAALVCHAVSHDYSPDFAWPAESGWLSFWLGCATLTVLVGLHTIAFSAGALATPWCVIPRTQGFPYYILCAIISCGFVFVEILITLSGWARAPLLLRFSLTLLGSVVCGFCATAAVCAFKLLGRV